MKFFIPQDVLQQKLDRAKLWPNEKMVEEIYQILKNIDFSAEKLDSIIDESESLFSQYIGTGDNHPERAIGGHEWYDRDRNILSLRPFLPTVKSILERSNL